MPRWTTHRLLQMVVIVNDAFAWQFTSFEERAALAGVAEENIHRTGSPIVCGC